VNDDVFVTTVPGYGRPRPPASPWVKRWLAIAAGFFVLVLVAGGTVWYSLQPDESDFGPTGFGKLKLSMTREQALATGDLSASPSYSDYGCDNYSYSTGPQPDPAVAAAVVSADKAYNEAAEFGGGLMTGAGPDPSLDDLSRSAQRLQLAAKVSELRGRLHEERMARIDARLAEFVNTGGAVFSKTGLRLIQAPPGVRTEAGIGRDSTVGELEAAYAGDGLREQSEDYYVVSAGEPDWVYGFSTSDGRVTSLTLRNTARRCAA
jgi:hypothetical protein